MPDGAQRGRLEQEQAGQPDGDREAAERDRLAGRRDGPLDRVRDGPAARAAPRGIG